MLAHLKRPPANKTKKHHLPNPILAWKTLLLDIFSPGSCLANFHVKIRTRHWPKVNSKVLRVSFYFYSFTELWEKESLIILSSPQLFKKVANAFPVHFNHIDKSNSHLIRALKFLAPLQIKLRTYFLNQISTARIFILSKRETGIL